jgi:hypothetical protein
MMKEGKSSPKPQEEPGIYDSSCSAPCSAQYALKAGARASEGAAIRFTMAIAYARPGAAYRKND